VAAAGTSALVVWQLTRGRAPPPAGPAIAATPPESPDVGGRPAPPGAGAVEGTVLDPAGRALAGVEVQVTQGGDGVLPGFRVRTRCDFDGRFRVDGLAPGRAEIVARRPGVLVGASDAVVVPRGGAARSDLVLREEGILAGRIRARPAAGAATSVVAIAINAGTGVRQAARAAVDASGEYRLSLPAGDYRVLAVAGDAPDDDSRAAPAFARVEPGRTSRLDLALSTARPDVGVELVVLEPGGAPSPGAAVTFARAGDGRIALATRAGADGRVAIGATMGISGPVTIRAQNGERTGAQTVELPAAGPVTVRLAPAPPRPR
jgi:hypothetical protein